MDTISAYREVGTYRGAAVACGATHKTVKRVIARHETGGDPHQERSFNTVFTKASACVSA
jgi:hypothetical protein